MGATASALDAGEQLLERLEQTAQWPPKWETCWDQVRIWQAFREADGAFLRRHAGWDTVEHKDRNYIVDSMASKISATFAELVFGEDPTITAANEQDQDRLEEIVEANALPSELQYAAEISSSEGEVWWRILVDRDQADVPLIEWHSRLNVIPVFRGRALLAAAFVSQIRPDLDKKQVWRYIEIHSPGMVRNTLFKGTVDRMGERVGLDQRPETADLPEEWNHGLDMLCGRVLNKRGKRPQLGRSDLQPVRDYLFALNETVTIGQENARLTLKKRVTVPEDFLDVRGNFPAGADVIVVPTTDRDPDKPVPGLAQIEWEFDATSFIAYKDAQERTILGRVGLAKQLVDAGDPTADGRATGTALRLRLIPSVLATAGKGRYWDDELPNRVLVRAQQVDALPDEGQTGGFGYKWVAPGEAPVVERTDPLPQDETEEAQRHSVLVTAEIESRHQAISELHPDWDDAQIAGELKNITDEAQSLTPKLPAAQPPDGGGVLGSEDQGGGTAGQQA